MAGNVAASIEQLPQRFTGNDSSPVEGRIRLHIGRIHRDVVVKHDACFVEKPRGRATVEITTDAPTWAEIDAGRLSGIEAFRDRRLTVRGSVDAALNFEPCFDRPNAGGMRYWIDRVRAGGIEFCALSAGDRAAPPLILLHGLGATKTSWLTVVPALSGRYRVSALDLPGFGASSKPWGRYSARWFAEHVFRFMDEMGYEKARIAGNSMGGRVAMEMAMLDPDRIEAIACLAPAAAFSKRPMLLLARISRAELGMLLSRLPRKTLRDGLTQLFAEPSRIDDGWYDAAIDDFLNIWRSPRARLAFFTAARNIYLEEPFGDQGFWARLCEMTPPALYIYGRQDVLITPRFGPRVQHILPRAKVLMWDDCGHVPQLEWPDRTAQVLLEFFGAQDQRRRRRLGAPLPRVASFR
ncbi:MAG TPA: alpha/beta fold hydrolase [Actinomycetota bacterium]|nr:alpha/beta fold hydrolase [Actinomycetota bacterium]